MEKIKIYIALADVASYYKGNEVRCTTERLPGLNGLTAVKVEPDEFVVLNWTSAHVATIRKLSNKERREVRRSFI